MFFETVSLDFMFFTSISVNQLQIAKCKKDDEEEKKRKKKRNNTPHGLNRFLDYL